MSDIAFNGLATHKTEGKAVAYDDALTSIVALRNKLATYKSMSKRMKQSILDTIGAAETEIIELRTKRKRVVKRSP